MADRLFLGFAVLVVVLLAMPASAHRPLFAGADANRPEGAVRVADPSVSHVLYFHLTDDAPQKWFVFDSDSPRTVDMQIALPVAVSQGTFRPRVALFGPGWSDVPDLPIEPPRAGLGGYVFPAEEEAHRFYEPVTGTESHILVDTQVELTEPGTYYGVVWADEGSEGKVWVSIGQSEGFSWRDVTRLPRWIAQVRSFHEVSGWPRWAWLSALGLLACAAGVIAWLIRR